MTEYGLGRLHIPDERDESFPMSAVIPAEVPDRTYRYWWPDGWWGDQGATPQCVAYAWTHWVEDGPVTRAGHPTRADCEALYRQAQRVDQWPGENYDGTSVRAGAKILQARGRISEYRWAWDAATVVRALLSAGPVVVGTLWFEDMFRPDRHGHLSVTGAMAGGHAYLLNGVNTVEGRVRVKNSWGRRWGLRGSAWMALEDLDALLTRHRGEACLAIETTE